MVNHSSKSAMYRQGKMLSSRSYLFCRQGATSWRKSAGICMGEDGGVPGKRNVPRIL